MRIGIGVTTYNRPKHLDLWMKQIMTSIEWEYFRGYTNDHVLHGKQYEGACKKGYNYQLWIADDIKKKGIAFRKNECLKSLKDNDYIFLFDDDCFAIKDGWVDYFIDAHKASGQHHFLYLKETLTIKKVQTIPVSSSTKEKECFDIKLKIDEYDNCGGCFMFLTKEVIEKVGGYCRDYGRYGYEHAGYTSRIHAAGLTPMGKYLCPQGAGEYIYAMDYDNHLWFNKKVNHQPSIMNEINMLPSWLSDNKKVYERDIQTIYQPFTNH